MVGGTLAATELNPASVAAKAPPTSKYRQFIDTEKIILELSLA